MVLLVIRQYEGKSYRVFVDWLVEAYYLRMVLQLSRIPHFTTLQKEKSTNVKTNTPPFFYTVMDGNFNLGMIIYIL